MGSVVIRLVETAKARVDLLVRMGGLNTNRVYLNSGKIQVECISDLDNILVRCISVLRIRASFPSFFS